MNSGFGSINFRDIAKGALISALMVFIASITEVLNSGTFPTGASLKQYAGFALMAGLSYIGKNLFTNSKNEIGKEPEAPKQ